MNGPRPRPAPRLEIRELCAVCGKTILPGHAVSESLSAGAVIHTRCGPESENRHA